MATKQAMKEICSTLPNMVIYVYRRISVMYRWQILSAFLPYMGIVTICWIIIRYNRLHDRFEKKNANSFPYFTGFRFHWIIFIPLEKNGRCSLWKQNSCDTAYTIVATKFVVATLIRYLFPRTHLCSCDLYIPKKN